MATFLETKRLRLTQPSLDDLDDLYALQSDPEVMHFIGEGEGRSKEEVLKWLQQAILHFEKHGFALCSVFEKDSGKFVGRAGLIFIAYDDEQSDIEVGYAFVKAAWQKGYATEVTKALIDWGFNHLPVTKIVGIINPKNNRSRHVLEKSGMHYAGVGYYWDKDVLVYQIFKNPLDLTKVEIKPASIESYPIIQNMGRFYVYDMSEYLGMQPGWEIPDDGLYSCIDFKKYWENKKAHPFLIYYNGELAGFAIVDNKGSAIDVKFNMAQFFILRKFKFKGLGRFVAESLFKRFKGRWEVMVMPGNEGACRFWRAVIENFTHGKYRLVSREVVHLDKHKKNIFCFRS